MSFSGVLSDKISLKSKKLTIGKIKKIDAVTEPAQRRLPVFPVL
jgi:hypothetical protein